MNSITTETGTTVSIRETEEGREVFLHHPKAPAFLNKRVAGRVIEGGFQPALFAAFSLSPSALRAIADLIEAAR